MSAFRKLMAYGLWFKLRGDTAPFSPIHQLFRGSTMSTVDCKERLTATPFLQHWKPHDGVAPLENLRDDEPWTPQTETLLQTWSRSWDRKAAAHGSAEGHMRKGHLMLQIPTVLIPIILAPILAAKLLDETNEGVIAALVISGRRFPHLARTQREMAGYRVNSDANKGRVRVPSLSLVCKVSPARCRPSCPSTGKASNMRRRPTSTTTCSRTSRKCSPKTLGFALAAT